MNSLKDKILFGLFFACLLFIVIMVWQRQTIRELRNKPLISSDTTITQHNYPDTIDPTTITLKAISYLPEFKIKTNNYMPFFIKIIEKDTVIQTISSDSLIKDYYATRYYDDILKDDRTGYVRIQSTVNKNTLTDRRLFYEARCQDKVITKTVQDNSMDLYFSPSLMVSRNQVGIQGSLILATKKDRMFTIGGGYFSEPFLSAGIGFKF